MERRQQDRRTEARGGRRVADLPGFTPLILLIDADSRRQSIAEAILAKLQFSVATVGSVEQALSLIRTLDPAAIVCRAGDVRHLRGAGRPIVCLTDDERGCEALVESIRKALRAAAH